MTTQMLLERPAAPAQKMMLVTSNDGGGGMSSMTYDSRLQYKTPNVTDRVKTEQTKDQSLVQDFSTRRALNLKKNWVSEADPKKAAANSNPSKKNSEAALAEIDNRLKSLMDRLSSQQKLLKPAEKPSSEMQHFLDSTSSSQSQQNNTSMASSASTSALLESSSSAITSPTTVTSPPATSSFLRSPPAAPSSTSQNNSSNPRFMQGAMPKAYRSMSSEQQSEKVDKSFEEVESIAVPELMPSKITSESSDYETEDEVKDAKVENSQDVVVAPEAENISHVSIAAALPNESSSFGEEFESCNEGDESADAANVEAVNPSLLILNNESKNANESSIFATPDPDQPPPPTDPPPPLATSSPYTSMEQQIDFIDSEDKSESIAAEVEQPKPKPLLFGDADVTDIYREKDHKERMVKYNNFREKEKSVVADLILSNGGTGGMGSRRSNGNRSSSAVTRSRSGLFSFKHLYFRKATQYF